MPEITTRATDASVDDVLARVPSAGRREDALILREMLERVTGEPAVMWGPTIVGFGRYRYRYDSGHGGEMCRIGFAARSASMSLYGVNSPGSEELLPLLGPHRAGVACVWVGRFGRLDLGVLERLYRIGWAYRGPDEVPLEA